MKKLLYILLFTLVLIQTVNASNTVIIPIGGKSVTFTESSTSPGTWTSPNGYTIIDQGAIDPKNDGNVTVTGPNGITSTLEGLDDFDLGITAIGDTIAIMENTNPTTNTTQPDDNAGVDKAVYDNAIADGKTPAEASALAGGYKPPAGSTPDNSTNNILGERNSDLRTGNVDMSTIPKIIISVINVLLGIAGTVAVVALIYYAVQMQINSGITGDSSGVDKAKKGMTGALIGFVVAILAWFIVIRFVEILSSVS